MIARAAASVSWLALAGLGLGVPSARAERPPRRPSLAVAATGDEAAVRAVRTALAGRMAIPFEVHVIRPPVEPSSRPGEASAARSGVESRLALAQQAYVDADFDVCFSALGEEDEALGHLGAGRRAVAEQLLFWRIACAVGASDPVVAERAARRFAVLDLGVPSLVAASHPQVANVLALAREAILAAPRRAVRVESTATGATVAVDGRAERRAAPCTLDLAPGDHVLALEADGFEPEARTVRVDDRTTNVRMDPRPATPELAARQWAARWAPSPAVDSAPSMRLLARAVRARRLVLVTAEEEGRGLRLRAVLVVDGRLAARGERQAEDVRAVADDLAALLRDLLVRGQLLEPAPPLWGRAWFWVAVGLTAAAAASVTAAVVWAPDTRTEVSF